MKTTVWNLVRIRVAALLIVTPLLGAPLRAEIPNVDRVPGDAVFTIGVSDTAAFWQNLHATPIAQAIEKYLNGPEMQQNLDYQQFQLERKQLAQELGFPVTLDELMGNVFKSGTVFALAPAIGQDQPRVVALMTARDKAKVTKIAEVLGQRYDMLRGAGTDGTSRVEKIEINGQQVTQVMSADPNTSETHGIFYSIVGEDLILGNDRDTFSSAMAKAENALSAGTDLNTLKSLLPWDKAHVTGYVNGDALVSSLRASAQIPQLAGLPSDLKLAFTTSVSPQSVLTQFASTADPAKTSARIQPGALDGLKFIPTTALIGMGSRSYDVEQSFVQLNQMLSNPMIAASMGSTGGASPLQTIEQNLGISVREDLIPALENEMFFSFSDLKLNMMMPVLSTLDLVMGSRLRDESRMKATMQKIEAAVARQTQTEAAEPGQQPTPGLAFSSIQHNGTEIRTLAMPIVSPTYAIHNGFLILGSNSISVSSAIDRAASGGDTLMAQPAYQQMTGMIGDVPLYDFQTFNLVRIVQTVVQPILAMQVDPATGLPAVPSVVPEILSHLGHLSTIQGRKSDQLVGFINFQMQ